MKLRKINFILFIGSWVLCLWWTQISSASVLSSVEKSKEALRLIEEEKFFEAEDRLLKAVAEDPYNPILKFNLGFVFELQKKYDKAVAEYESVLRNKTLPDELRFATYFNLGNSHAQNQGDDKNQRSQLQIAKALQAYQKALELKSDSQEVKNNIEMLFMGGKGKGKGDGKGDPSDNPEGNKGPPDPNNPGQPQNKPNFKGEKLSRDDVRKIMEELKSQEQKVRALEYGNQKSSDTPTEKDW